MTYKDDEIYLLAFIDNSLSEYGIILPVQQVNQLKDLVIHWDFTSSTSYKQKLLATSKILNAFIIGLNSNKNDKKLRNI